MDDKLGYLNDAVAITTALAFFDECERETAYAEAASVGGNFRDDIAEREMALALADCEE